MTIYRAKYVMTAPWLAAQLGIPDSVEIERVSFDVDRRIYSVYLTSPEEVQFDIGEDYTLRLEKISEGQEIPEVQRKQPDDY